MKVRTMWSTLDSLQNPFVVKPEIQELFVYYDEGEGYIMLYHISPFLAIMK